MDDDDHLMRPFLLACAIGLIAWLRELTQQQEEGASSAALTRVYTVYTCLLLVLVACSLPDSNEFGPSAARKESS